MLRTKVYGRIKLNLPKNTDRAEILTPGGEVQALWLYSHCDADFTYDCHGYETVTLRGNPCKQAAYTATQEGRHLLRAYSGVELIEETPIECNGTDNGGFVEVSRRDPRYFVLSDGKPYVPIGPNLVGSSYNRLPAGREHFKRSSQTATTGLIEWKRWFKAMKKAGANYTRIWLSNRYTQARTGIMGIHDPVALARFDALIELARENGIRLKLCLEHWRSFSDESHFAYKYYIDPDTGNQLKDENEWFESPLWNERWLKDIEPYLARCQNDPVVFAWELWNEIECGAANFEAVTSFTERMLPAVKKLSPMNLVVNSLGSLDNEDWSQPHQNRFAEIESMDFLQVHRYLDQGTQLEICHTDPVAFSIDAIERTKRPNKPVILTETGAVNDSHTGPFRFYGCDHDGLIFHDVTYPALFAGAAGSGHIWHWESYVEPKNLWRHFTPMVKVLEGIQMDTEDFISGVIPHSDAWILTLVGNTHILVLVRNKTDRWDMVLRDDIAPKPIENLHIMLTDKKPDYAKVFWLMDENPGELEITGNGVKLPVFIHGGVIRIKK
jgi:hypothetical protein